ncbi:MAG: hypothetical protein KKB36_06580, partial [Gammaproteobacteria bacterium]|nr:hypothetical protein [Gammaproteobacteria bacterium]MBU0885424.1 hypothetical protein [Gammaproteobacteria bacterium]
GATAAALVDLSTVAGKKISNPPWVKFQSAGWVNFPSAPTEQELLLRPLGAFFDASSRPIKTHQATPDQSTKHTVFMASDWIPD